MNEIVSIRGFFGGITKIKILVHCWGYRRYVAQKSGVSNESEYAFSTKKIESNFSNYSAWHQRSKLIPLLKPTPQELKIALNDGLFFFFWKILGKFKKFYRF